MNFQEKYQEYKQRREAKKFFNHNNNEKLKNNDYLIAILVGVGVSFILGFIMTWIIYKINFNLSYFAIAVGVVEAMAIKKVLNKSGNTLAIIAIVTYVLGVLLAQAFYFSMLFPVINIQVFVGLLQSCFKNLFVGDFFDTIIFLFGAIAAYMTLKD